MQSLTEAQVADVIGNWARKAQLPPGWLYATGLLKPEVERDLVDIIQNQLHREVSFHNLDSAAVLKVQADAEAVREHARLEALYREIGKVIETHFPDLDNRVQDNIARVVAFAKDPGFGVDAFVADVTYHPDLWAWKSGPKQVDLVDMLRHKPKAEVAAIYGQEATDKAFATLEKRIHRITEAARPSWMVDPASKQEAEAAATQRRLERDPKAIARATESCQGLVDRLIVSTNHSENKRAKEALAQVIVRTEGAFDPFRTKEAREQWIRDYVPEHERKH